MRCILRGASASASQEYDGFVSKNRDRFIAAARAADRESKYLDFKRDFDIESVASWCEVIKDIVALANSGGGIIIFGAENDGSYTGLGCKSLLAYDQVNIVNKIESYTRIQLSDIEIVPIKRGRNVCAAILVPASEIPIIFMQPGTYPIIGGKQKTVFAKGTLYFRHGAKSEPGNINDLISWRDKEISRIKKSWMGGMRQVVELPSGHTLTAVPHSYGHGATISAKLTSDVSGVNIIPGNTEELWPHRQKDLLEKVNKVIKPQINPHDIQCINKNTKVFTKRREFAHKPHKHSAPQYSDLYAQWLIDEWRKNPAFFKAMRETYKKSSPSR